MDFATHRHRETVHRHLNIGYALCAANLSIRQMQSQSPELKQSYVSMAKRHQMHLIPIGIGAHIIIYVFGTVDWIGQSQMTFL